MANTDDTSDDDWREPPDRFGESLTGDVTTGTEDPTPEPKNVFERRQNPIAEGTSESWSETFNTVADRLKWWVPVAVLVGAALSGIEMIFEANGYDPDIPTAAVLWAVFIMVATAILLMLTRPRNVALTAAWAAAACLSASIAAVTVFATIPTFLGNIPEVVSLRATEGSSERLVFSLEVKRPVGASVEGDWATRFALRVADYIPVVAGLVASVMIFGKATNMIRELNKDHGRDPPA